MKVKIATGRAMLLAVCLTPMRVASATSAPATDGLGRLNPRSSVTGFLQACQSQDYQKASQYLDLRQLPPRYRDKQGPELAKKLEAILNSDSGFNVLRLSRNPEGDLSDDSDPNREHVATIAQGGQNLTLDLERVTLQPGGPEVWLFSQDTVAAIPNIHTPTTPPATSSTASP